MFSFGEILLILVVSLIVLGPVQLNKLIKHIASIITKFRQLKQNIYNSVELTQHTKKAHDSAYSLSKQFYQPELDFDIQPELFDLSNARDNN